MEFESIQIMEKTQSENLNRTNMGRALSFDNIQPINDQD